MKKTALAALGAAALLLLTGCTDSSAPAEGGATNDGGDLTPVSVGVIPIADTAALWLGVEQGFFEDEGLDVTIETASGGAAIVPAVIAGDYQFGFSNTLSLMVAAEHLPIRMVSAAVASTGDTAADMGAVVTKADSGIAGPADLAGKTVSSNSVGNINDTVVRDAVDEAGADSSTISFVEVPFPEAVAAVQNDQVDSAFVVEPFVTAAKEAGLTVVTFAKDDVDAELEEKFVSAMQTSLEYAQANPDEVRRILGTYTQTPAEVLEKITLPTFPTEMNRAAIERLAEAAQSYGVLSKTPDFDKLLP